MSNLDALELKDIARTDKDTGSAEAQIYFFTKKINHLTEHIKIHKKDFHSRRGLLMMVGKRNRLMTYLKNKNATKYVEVADKLKLRKK
ncbi:MAG: 30S ribosomal protein S15 [Alphaproteobacteria bacterium]|jgi:small subunit ribosomal protein S15|tara:strand:+ start:2839 stop:3102 length:264 start_codon:yes stop_codon:yes gene_type:complete